MTLAGFEVIPSIDILDGAQVRLEQGSYDDVTVYESDPSKAARCNLWWIVDLNRQSLDKLLNLNRVRQLYEIFVSFGWEVIVLK